MDFSCNEAGERDNAARGGVVDEPDPGEEDNATRGGVAVDPIPEPDPGDGDNAARGGVAVDPVPEQDPGDGEGAVIVGDQSVRLIQAETSGHRKHVTGLQKLLHKF